jgi:hypothetical protein
VISREKCGSGGDMAEAVPCNRERNHLKSPAYQARTLPDEISVTFPSRLLPGGCPVADGASGKRFPMRLGRSCRKVSLSPSEPLLLRRPWKPTLRPPGPPDSR